MTARRSILLLSLSTLLFSCDTEKKVHAEFECDAGEAAVRHLIGSLPDLNPGVAKNYSIVLGEITRTGIMTPADDAFTKRFDDLKLVFVNAINLTTIEPGPIIVENKSRLATFVLQLRTLRQTGEKAWEAEVGWSYKDQFGRQKITLESREGKIIVTASQKVD
ncbi:MAG: hypothetical protein JNG86_04940 [Verrucomicrobiaceae bacterium]|nr:hypothetical protein [Verrucomicrobiaceae bacterium]